MSDDCIHLDNLQLLADSSLDPSTYTPRVASGAGAARGGSRWGRCRLEPDLESALVFKFSNLMKEKVTFKLEPWFSL